MSPWAFSHGGAAAGCLFRESVFLGHLQFRELEGLWALGKEKERIWINPSSCWGMDYGVWTCESLHCVPPIEALLMKFWCRPLFLFCFLLVFLSPKCFLFADLEHFRWRVSLQKFLGEFNHVGHKFVFWDQVRAGDLELQIQVLSWKFLRIGVSLMSTDYCVLISSELEILSCKSRFWSRDFPHMRMPGLDFFWGMEWFLFWICFLKIRGFAVQL